MTEQEVKALARIAAATDPAVIEQIVRNARGKSPIVEQAALRRLADVSAMHDPGTVEHACWKMVHTVEALRRLKGQRVWRMHRMRPKIDKDGEIGALEYCALNETEGFTEVISYGLPELTAEAIVLRFPQAFSLAAREAGRKRLEAAGVRVDASGNIA